MTAVAGAATAAILLASASSAAAQTAEPAGPSGSPFWVVAGGGHAIARAGCATCDRAGVFTNSYGILVDAGVRVTPKVDVGIELVWISSRLVGEDPVRTTFILGIAQVRPFEKHGLFLRTGMGIGFAGNGLFSPLRPNLAPPFTTNALGLTYGIGWVFRRERRWTMQVQATHHVAALGELTTTAGTSVRNVVGNYWMTGAALAVR
jgi:hypothetical protein